MDIDTLQKAIAIMNHDGKSGSVYGYHDEIQIYPLTDKFTQEQREDLGDLGFSQIEDDDGWYCFT